MAELKKMYTGGGFRTHDLQIMSITLYVDWHSRPG